MRGGLHLADDFILATLFYEASTRTRFSFESAMMRLGGNVLSSADPKTTSAAKGETIADTIRVLENYADAIVIRHPCEGSVRVAADYADVPIINAGDGGHEHPTQTLCDLYTLRREKGTLKNLNVLLWGDLKNGRTVHSLVYGLARFGARIIPCRPKGSACPSTSRAGCSAITIACLLREDDLAETRQRRISRSTWCTSLPKSRTSDRSFPTSRRKGPKCCRSGCRTTPCRKSTPVM